MELRDYLAALRRHWRTWVGVTVAGALAALTVVLAVPPTYKVTAEVFVGSTSTGASSWQFVNQRVMSYPDLATSRTVLEPVIEQLGLRDSVRDLAGRVTAVNPSGTSQIQITVADSDGRHAAAVANAVADRFRTAVVELEKPTGGPSPVELTVTNPATAPSTPAFPQPSLFLILGITVGLLLGAAAAVVRSRRDTRLWSEADVRAAWGHGGDDLEVHAPVRRRRRDRGRSLASSSATVLARQVEALADAGPVRMVALSPSRDDQAAQGFVGEVADALRTWSVPVYRTPPSAVEASRQGRPGVALTVGSPLAPLRTLRSLTGAGSQVVVVIVEVGHVEEADVRELRATLAAAGAGPVAVVLQGRRRRRTTTTTREGEREGALPAVPHAEPSRQVPVSANRG